MPITNSRMTLEEQLLRRQSAPRATAEADALKRNLPEVERAAEEPEFQPIGRNQIEEARRILEEYREGKDALDNQIVENEEWYKLRHWDYLRRKEKNQVEPVSAWLFNCIANKHADIMDNFPQANILPREASDKAQAKILSSILPVILDNIEFEETYSTVSDYKLKNGTGVYGIFWDPTKNNGIGDINIVKADLLNLFWENGISDIQKSRNFFSVELRDNDLLEQDYPILHGKLGTDAEMTKKYRLAKEIDTSKKSLVIDWYYKKKVGTKTVLHYCKFVGDTVLFATENEREYRERGLYDHGRYPFEFDPLFRMENSATGIGYIGVGKSAQEMIDREDQAIQQNMAVNAKPRFFVRQDGGVNKEQFADMTQEIVDVSGSLGEDSVRPIVGAPISEAYINVKNAKIEELKEVTGTRDVSTGGTPSGVTAASAISALIESGSKLSRDTNKAGYRAFRRVIFVVIELLRQFYTAPRWFRILGEAGTQDFVSWSNAEIVAQKQDEMLGGGVRLPVFDIEVVPQKQSPYSKMAQNELAIQFYSAGFFTPGNADASLACLEMMDFDRKDFVMQRIAQNGTMYQMLQQMQAQLLALAQMVDDDRGTNFAASFAAQTGQGSAEAPTGSQGAAQKAGAGEDAGTQKARQRTAEATSPR